MTPRRQPARPISCGLRCRPDAGRSRRCRSAACSWSWRPGRSPASSAMSIAAATTTWTPTRSAPALRPSRRTSSALAEAGARGCGMGRLRIIGLEAEAAMLAATAGVNTHRGAIFGLGLLCAAAGARATGRLEPALSLGAIVSRLWGDEHPRWARAAAQPRQRRRVVALAPVAHACEAARGFPSVYDVGLPALRRGARDAPDDAEAARVEACFALIAALEDTNLLHRGGLAGLRFAQRRGAAVPRRGRRRQARLARARPIGPCRASSPAGSVQAGRPTSSP